jgi:hypothetical protein
MPFYMRVYLQVSPTDRLLANIHFLRNIQIKQLLSLPSFMTLQGYLKLVVTMLPTYNKTASQLACRSEYGALFVITKQLHLSNTPPTMAIQ